MTHPFIIVGLKTATLFLGGMITFYAFRAYRRTHSPALRALAIGFGAITIGSLTAGAMDQLLAVDRQLALIVESGLTAIGFGVILYSLHAD
ncbi:hypothetical protein G9464_19970 [Halostella sp. JP-L12]|uniref:DUF7521 family protein n=1 Tax=Halostella TaxID=1843185 RepID=UPI000EF7D571|nr:MULTISPECIES: hypothetical protein [Halostella]NHN49849.1 hypothetical protein [Halostella sp. JP-L12]